MVHTINTAQRVNGVDARRSIAQAQRLAQMSRMAVQRAGEVTHLLDPTGRPAIKERSVAEALQTLPEHIQEDIRRKGGGKGSALSYVTAHLLMHDTRVELQPLGPDEAEPIVPQRVISIGAKSERPFYEARMASRAAAVLLPGAVQETGQLFTKHDIPPYNKCREGEPSIAEVMQTYPLRHPLEWGYDPLYDLQHPNPSVQRDLKYVAEYLQAQEDPQLRAYQDMITDLHRRQGEL